MDLETRELRYFIAVAEELHFGRAAARLRIAQPAVSKTVQRLEARLNVQLLIRSSRSVRLTSAGTVLLQQGRLALNAMTTAADSAKRAGDGEHLRLLIKPGGDANLLSPIIAAYAEQPGARPVDILFSGSTDRTAYLHEDRADVALMYAPFDDLRGLTAETLLTEERVAVLPANHPLAARHHLRAEELAHETFARWTGVDDNTDGPEVADLAELIPLVRLGRVITILPRSLITPLPTDIALVPVSDADQSTIVIARRTEDHRASVTALINAAIAATKHA